MAITNCITHGWSKKKFQYTMINIGDEESFDTTENFIPWSIKFVVENMNYNTILITFKHMIGTQ